MDRIYIADCTYRNSVKFSVEPLLSQAGMRWMVRVRINCPGRTVSDSIKWQASDGKKVTSHCIDRLSHTVYSVNKILTTMKHNSAIDPCLELGSAVASSSSDSGVTINEVLGTCKLKGDLTGQCSTKIRNGHLRLPYMVTCSLVVERALSIDGDVSEKRVIHVFNLPNSSDYYEILSEWTPVEKELPEEMEVVVAIWSGSLSKVYLTQQSTITLELKQI